MLAVVAVESSTVVVQVLAVMVVAVLAVALEV
jgi:hypothetical protein